MWQKLNQLIRESAFYIQSRENLKLVWLWDHDVRQLSPTYLKFVMRSKIKLLLKVYKKDVIDHYSGGQISVLGQE